MRLGERSVAYLLGGGRAHLCGLRVTVRSVSDRFAWHSPLARLVCATTTCAEGRS